MGLVSQKLETIKGISRFAVYILHVKLSVNNTKWAGLLAIWV